MHGLGVHGGWQTTLWVSLGHGHSRTRGFKILGEGFTIILGYKALAILKLKTEQVTKHVNLSGSTSVT